MKIKPTVFGVGVNDSDYEVRGCPFYRKWRGILQRCYQEKFKKAHPTYSAATVIEEWKTFSVFKSWMADQNWEGMELDKDILCKGNKVYGPDTCLFISLDINRVLCLRENKRGDCKLGVKKVNGRGKPFMARCNKYGKSVYLGTFDSEDEAHLAYLKAKNSYIQELAQSETDVRIKNALLELEVTYGS